ncbi:non-homologous end-joining DNA ligase [Alkaliphilus crotonatoxidans]
MAKLKERYTVSIEGQQVDVTHPTKLIWPHIQKLAYLQYLIEVSPYLLPYLNNRALTTIRYPHGVSGEFFYQKSCPSYAPDFVDTHYSDDINYIVCSSLPTLVWLGNQGAIDLHVPFNTIDSSRPAEIVFDLDPPSREYFHLAIEAALILKEVFDRLKLVSFVKTSGNKGLQLYIPLPDNQFTYDETRSFTSFAAQYVVGLEPRWFTTERMKKKRGNRLYVDYLQHAPGKTIIAPYSLRGNDEALAATPLFWDEVTRELRPEEFPMEVIMDRLKKKGCPFENYTASKTQQNFTDVLNQLKETIAPRLN